MALAFLLWLWFEPHGRHLVRYAAIRLDTCVFSECSNFPSQEDWNIFKSVHTCKRKWISHSSKLVINLMWGHSKFSVEPWKIFNIRANLTSRNSEGQCWLALMSRLKSHKMKAVSISIQQYTYINMSCIWGWYGIYYIVFRIPPGIKKLSL